MSSEKAVFDADVSGFLRGLKQIQAQEKEAKRDIQALAIAAAAGSKTATQGYIQQSKELARLSQQKQQYQTQLNAVIHGTNAWQSSSNKANMVISQLSFAVDDFATVVGQTGLAGGLRAAANNLSMVLAQFNPMLVVVPSITAAIVGFVMKTDDAAKATDRNKEAMDRAKESAQQYQDVLTTLATGIEKASKTPAQIAMDAESKQIAGAQSNLAGQLAQTDAAIRGKRAEVAATRAEAKRLGVGPFPQAELAARADAMEGDLSPLLAQRAAITDQLTEIQAQKKRLDNARMSDTINNTIVPRVRGAFRAAKDFVMDAGGQVSVRARQQQIDAIGEKVKAKQEDLQAMRGDKAAKEQVKAAEQSIKALEKTAEGLTKELKALVDELKRGGGPDFIERGATLLREGQGR